MCTLRVGELSAMPILALILRAQRSNTVLEYLTSPKFMYGSKSVIGQGVEIVEGKRTN